MRTAHLVIFLLAVLSAPAARAQDDSISFGAFYKPVCDTFVSGFEKATATNYAAWSNQHREAIAKLEADAGFIAKRKEALQPPSAEFAATKQRQLTAMCERVAGLFESAAPADTRFTTSERTWDTFRTGLRAANREAVFSCLTGNARKILAGRLHAMTDDQLRRMDSAIAELKLSQDNGAFQEGVIVQSDGKAGTVVFVKVGANWKIGEM